jgi:hypothetical protein
MKMIAEYLDHALDFERMATEAEDGPFKASLLNQALAYRSLAVERSDKLGVPLPADPMRAYLKDHPTAFDPETLAILSGALDEAWRQVEADKVTYKIDGHAEGARSALAKFILDMAKRGERNPQRLVIGLLARLRL